MQLRQTGLNTGEYGYNAWTVSWPAAFGNTLYAVVCAPTSDSGNVAGGEFKVAGRTTTAVTFNYNHITAIGNPEVYYAVIAIGKKP